MAPPPATPASSSKFLLPKRQPALSQQHMTSSQANGVPRQFNPTPRFSVSSTPRPASSQGPRFSTPANLLSRGSASRRKATQDLIDIESSPEPSDSESPSGRERHDLREGDDVITSFVSESPSHEHQGGRSSKRRRISISPESGSSPPRAVHPPTVPQHRLDIDIDSPSQSETEEAEGESEAWESDDEQGNKSPPQPASPPQFLLQAETQAETQARRAFKPPPPFKQQSTAASLEPQYPLPDAFSPQRRGAKYVNGGLAGELRDWLVAVKGRSDGPDTTTTTAGSKAAAPEQSTVEGRIVVEEVRRGSGFWLARGRSGAEDGVRVVLGGEGRLCGLAERRTSVVSGCTLAILPPMWDIELDGQAWKVVCDWYLVSQEG